MVIKRCTCISKYQDEKFGVGMRAHNPMKKDGERCTVCGKPEGGREVRLRDFIKQHKKEIHG